MDFDSFCSGVLNCLTRKKDFIAFWKNQRLDSESYRELFNCAKAALIRVNTLKFVTSHWCSRNEMLTERTNWWAYFCFHRIQFVWHRRDFGLYTWISVYISFSGQIHSDMTWHSWVIARVRCSTLEFPVVFHSEYSTCTMVWLQN